MYTIIQPEKHLTSPTVDERELLERAESQLIILENSDETEIAQAIASCDAVMCGAANITRELMASAKNLRAVAKLGVGVDNIDVEAASDLGIAVTNVPDFATEPVSEHTIMLIFACARKTAYLDKAVRSGEWNVRLESFLGSVTGNTLGLVGFGKIGRAVARLATAVGMSVIAYDPYVSKEEMLSECRTESTDSLEALLERADFVSLHTPLTKGTQNLISAAEFARMKKGAYLINCGRGALVDEKALLEAIESGQIAGAGLDVLQQEPPAPDNPLLKCPEIVFTPHCAAHTVRALSTLRSTAISSVLQAFSGQWPDNVVNPDVREAWCSRFGKE